MQQQTQLVRPMFSDTCYNEMYAQDGSVRAHYQPLADWLTSTPSERIGQMRQAAQILFHRVGITFAVYGDESGAERLIPFDILPHVIPLSEWRELQAGLKQRVRALNMFLHDVYHEQEILKAGRVPAAKVTGNVLFRHEMQGINVPGGIYAHIAGVDLVRAGKGEYYVLEDNLRTPSGVSYMLEDRKMMMRLVPELFGRQRIEPVEHYPDLLLETLRSVAPQGVHNPTVVLLTPGQYNSAYFEHAFLAQQMGIELVEGRRPAGQGRCRLHAHDQRTAAGGRGVPAHRRRLPRPAGVPIRFDARRAGPGVGLPQGPRHPGQCRGHRCGRRQVGLSLCAGDDSLLPGRGADHRQRPDLAAGKAGGLRLRAGAGWTSWW